LQAGKISIADIDEQLISSKLYTREIPDPDLIIRTGGEMRFVELLALASRIFRTLRDTTTLAQTSRRKNYDKAVTEFGERERRWGS
jgi:undecaprenyl diphosphate synthase